MFNFYLSQIFLGTLFLLLTLITLTFPGFLILKKIRFEMDNILEKYVVSTTLGLVIFTLSAYILAGLHLRFVMFMFPILGLLTFWKFRKEIIKGKINISNKTLLFTILVIGIIFQVAVNAPSGISFSEGIYFWSSHGHDGVWHLSLMEQMHNDQFPFQNPEFSSHKLQNYHFFVDLLMSEFSRLYSFSNLDIYFRFMPILFSTLLGLGSFIFVKYWTKSESAGIWALIFTYFAGSFGYLLYIPTHKDLGGESMFWVSQTHSVLGNPPHAAAFIIMVVFLFCLLKFLKSYKLSDFIICTILGGSIIGFKVYGGVLILGGLFLIGLFELIFRRAFRTLILFLTTLSLSLLIYLPNSANSQDFLIWQPWWYIRTMVVAPDRLNWIDLELRRQTYIAEGNLKRVIQLEATAFLIFLFGNLGMRFLGFYTLALSLKNALRNSFNLYLILMCLTSFVFPLLFLQKGVAGNSIQFFQYFLLIFSIFAAVSVSKIMDKIKKNSVKIFLGIVIIILSIPTQIGLIYNFYSNLPLARIDKKELSALNFFKKTPTDTVILTAPFNKNVKSSDLIPPIWLWSDTSYVTALSGRRTYIADEEQINILGYNLEERIAFQRNIFEENTPEQVKQNLLSRKIDYLYFPKILEPKVDLSEANLKKVFSNSEIEIWQVSKN